MSPSVLVVLGAPNDATGVLGPASRSRIDRALEEYRVRRWPILPTGGFGAQFNVAPLAHHEYVRAALLNAGVPDAAILPGLSSRHTKEDADMACDFARCNGFERLHVITSAFHCRRAALLFQNSAPSLTIEMLPASDDGIDPVDLARLRSHEALRIAELERLYASPT